MIYYKGLQMRFFVGFHFMRMSKSVLDQIYIVYLKSLCKSKELRQNVFLKRNFFVTNTKIREIFAGIIEI